MTLNPDTWAGSLLLALRSGASTVPALEEAAGVARGTLAKPARALHKAGLVDRRRRPQPDVKGNNPFELTLSADGEAAALRMLRWWHAEGAK